MIEMSQSKKPGVKKAVTNQSCQSPLDVVIEVCTGNLSDNGQRRAVPQQMTTRYDAQARVSVATKRQTPEVRRVSPGLLHTKRPQKGGGRTEKGARGQSKQTLFGLGR